MYPVCNIIVQIFSRLREELGEIFGLPRGQVEFAPQRNLGPVPLHQIKSHMPQNSEIIRAVAHTASNLILVHNNIEDPVESVLDAPMRANRPAETLGRQTRAEQVVSGF